MAKFNTKNTEEVRFLASYPPTEIDEKLEKVNISKTDRMVWFGSNEYNFRDGKMVICCQTRFRAEKINEKYWQQLDSILGQGMWCAIKSGDTTKNTKQYTHAQTLELLEREIYVAEKCMEESKGLPNPEYLKAAISTLKNIHKFEELKTCK